MIGFLLGSTVSLTNRTWINPRYIQQLRVAGSSPTIRIEAILYPSGTVPLNGLYDSESEAEAALDRLVQGFDPGTLVS